MFSVLIISDKKDTRELIAMFLRHKGYTAIPVSTCSEANYELENHYVSLIILERSATLLGKQIKTVAVIFRPSLFLKVPHLKICR